MPGRPWLTALLLVVATPVVAVCVLFSAASFPVSAEVVAFVVLGLGWGALVVALTVRAGLHPAWAVLLGLVCSGALLAGGLLWVISGIEGD